MGTQQRGSHDFPEKSRTKHYVNKLFKKMRDTGTVNRRLGSGSAHTEENAKLLLHKFPQSATDFVLLIVGKSDREHIFVHKENKVNGILRELLSRSLARFMRAVQFAPVSSCARHLLKHFRCKSLQIIWDKDDR